MYKKSRVLREIRHNLAKGAGVYNACQAAGISYFALWTWRNRRPMIERYMQKVLTQRVQLVEDALYKGALGGNTTAQIFYLKNRGANWKDAPYFDQSRHTHFVVEVNTDDNEYKAQENKVLSAYKPKKSLERSKQIPGTSSR